MNWHPQQLARIDVVERQLLGARNEPHRYVCSLQWVGSSHWPVRLDSRARISELPWPLQEISRDPLTQTTLYIRKDALAFIPYHWLVKRWIAHTLAFDAFQMRLILTAHIWGLGYTAANERPRWENLTRRRSGHR